MPHGHSWPELNTLTATILETLDVSLHMHGTELDLRIHK